MRVRTLTLAAGIAAVLAAPPRPLAAQEAESAVVTPGELDAALARDAARADAERRAVREALTLEEVARVARGMGVDPEAASAAVAALQGEELTRAAALSASIQEALAGGQVFSINAITLIVILLLVILVVLIAD